MGGGRRQHLEAFDAVAAAGRGDTGEVSHSELVGVRRLRSESLLLPDGLAAGSRGGNGLDRDSPALRICMETTRASLLWQAAAVRPEPERMTSLRGVTTRGVVSHVFGIVRVLLY